MPRVRPEQRHKMEQDGKWGLFKARKTELQRAGDTPADAHRKALGEFYRPGAGAVQRDAAVKMTALEVKLDEVSMLFEDCMPCGYGGLGPGTPLRQAWEAATNAMGAAVDRLDELGDLLRGNAGIDWKESRALAAELQDEPVEADAVPA